MGDAGLPNAALARGLVARPAEHVWAVIHDVDRFPGRVPMIDRIRREGPPGRERVTVDLRFKVAVVSVGFSFLAEVDKTEAPERRTLELRGISGEPRGIRLRFALTPGPEPGSSALETGVEFDIRSLGWLAKYFLKHHPEIQYGIFPGVALALFDSIRRAACDEPPLGR